MPIKSPPKPKLSQARLRSALLILEIISPFVLFITLVTHLPLLSIIAGIVIAAGFIATIVFG